jgi:hypothetical protein
LPDSYRGDSDVKETSEKQQLGNSVRAAWHVSIESSRNLLLHSRRLIIECSDVKPISNPIVERKVRRSKSRK